VLVSVSHCCGNSTIRPSLRLLSSGLSMYSFCCHESMRSACRRCVAMDLSFSGPVYSEKSLRRRRRRGSSVLPVYFFPRHYRSRLRFTRPEQLLDRVRGDADARPFCSYGAKVSEWPVTPSYASEGVGPSTLSTFFFSVTRRDA
jgi:hypothetical protein